MMIKSLKFSHLVIATLVFSQSVFAQNITSEQELKTVPNWFNLDTELDKINGISTEKAYQTLLKDKKASPVVVAIIDSGVEIDHIDLKGKIWTNEKEIPNNGIDDDKNGYVDDINGWDFLGNKNGDDIANETLELTREYSKYAELVAMIDPLNATKEQKNTLETFKNLKKKFEDKKKELDDQGGRFFIQLYDSFVEAKNDIKTEFKVDTVSDEILEKITLISNEKLQKAKRIYKILGEVNLDEAKLEEGYEYFNPLINYGLNEDYNGRRDVVGDNPKILNEKGYGNNEVEGPNAYHGTHIAGIIAAERNNEIGTKGIVENVKLMILRAVPSGDERDKDVGNAIKYAVDNGAKVINMSFGKSLSPEKEYVDEAVKYAEEKGVLLIHAAGNDNLDLDKEDNFPNKFYKNGGVASSWIEVGAISWKTGNDLTADFSNYGKTKVDIFAPGVDLYSLGINGKYREMSGTSMAAPVATGVAALILSYYPNFSAIQVKDIILESCFKIGNKDVYIPGKSSTTQFKNLSTTGGVVNAYNALKLAQKLSEKQ
jgi:subtilisin family serine protease